MSVHPNWQDVRGDDTYAINWPLTESSIVFEVGAYEGRWAKQILSKYNCTVHAFEPQLWAVEKLWQIQHKGLIVHPYALGKQNALLPMGEFNTDACSFLLKGIRAQGQGEMHDACAVLNGFENVDLMMINIEGYEYDLLTYMIECEAIKRIQRLCIQYHKFADQSGERYAWINDKLRQEGFYLAWSFYPTLEARVREVKECVY